MAGFWGAKCLAIKNILKMIKPSTIKMTKQQTELLMSLNACKLESKKQQDHIFKVLNGPDSDFKTIVKQVFNAPDFEGIQLSDDQNKQAL